MVTRRTAEVLLSVAQHRWPVELRAELRREWEAELHVLSERGQPAAMLRFAVSLAVRRSGAVVDRPPIGPRLLRSALPLALAPLACVGLLVVALVAMNALVGLLSWHNAWAYDLQLPMVTMQVTASAVGMAVIADRLARRVRTTGWRVIVGIMAPVALTVAVLEYATNQDLDQLALDAPGLTLWLAGLTLVLRGASVLAGRDRARAAWCLGAVGALVVADVAVVLAVLGHIPTGPGAVIDGVAQGDTLDPVSAPLWLFTCYTDTALGFPRPTAEEIFLITDEVLLEPLLFLACTPYALAWAIRAARRSEPAPGPAAPAPIAG